MVIDDLVIDRKEERAVNAFWLGFGIYTASATYGAAALESNPIFMGIQIVGLAFLIPAAAKLINFRIDNAYLRFLYYLYIGWMLLTVARGFTLDFMNIKKMFFDAWFGMFLYLAPLVMLLPRDIYYLRRLFDSITVLSLFFLLFAVLRRTFLLSSDMDSPASQQMTEFFSKNLSLPSGFILLTYVYHANKRRWLAVFVTMLTFVLAIYRARRGLSFMAASASIFALVLYFYANKGNIANRFIALALVGMLGYYGYKVYSGENKNSLFTLIIQRADEDTRSDVEDFFYKDMKDKDWLIGKGVNGEYYCPGIDGEGFSNYRDTIETDYLQIILKGGLVSLGLLLLIALPAVYNGIFRSKNVLTKAAGIWILLWLVSLYPSNVAIFNLSYLLVWISIGICYTPAIRNMLDREIKEILSTNGKAGLEQ